jgi:hypothetical protein
MFNSPYHSELPPELLQYLEYCYELPAFDPHVARAYSEIAHLLGNPELVERLREWGY